MTYQMLPKHYDGFTRAFPGLAKADYEQLFAAGFITPGDCKKASDEALGKVLSATKVKKLREGRGKKVAHAVLSKAIPAASTKTEKKS